MIIGVSGKIGSGKDTVGTIIQYLYYINSDIDEDKKVSYEVFHKTDRVNNLLISNTVPKIVKFADKLKDIVCILIGCTREQLEDIDFKNTPLGEEWIRYGKADGFFQSSKGTVMNNVSCSKEEFEEAYKINWQTAYKYKHTPRSILQMLGTEVGRFIHKDTWVNATIRDYKLINTVFGTAEPLGNGEYRIVGHGVYHGKIIKFPEYHYEIDPTYPNWIITDVRFPNEAKAVHNKNGIVIRVERDLSCEVCGLTKSERRGKQCNEITCPNGRQKHESETALDDYEFDYVIDNNGTIDDLIERVKEILLIEKLL